MQEFHVSPFDQMVIDSTQWILGNPAYVESTDLGKFIYSQAVILRTIFINYSKLNQPASFENGGNQKETQEEMISMSDQGIKVALDYFLLMNQLNQMGRVLKKKFGIEIPKFAEIRFFRNKIVEHWDDYLKMQRMGSAHQSDGKRPVPYLLWEKRTMPAEWDRIHDELIQTSQEACMPITKKELELHGEEYANAIYPILLSKEKFVALIFEYEFPLPIYDIEKYCQDLVVFFKSQKLTV